MTNDKSRLTFHFVSFNVQKCTRKTINTHIKHDHFSHFTELFTFRFHIIAQIRDQSRIFLQRKLVLSYDVIKLQERFFKQCEHKTLTKATTELIVRINLK